MGVKYAGVSSSLATLFPCSGGTPFPWAVLVPEHDAAGGQVELLIFLDIVSFYLHFQRRVLRPAAPFFFGAIPAPWPCLCP